MYAIADVLDLWYLTDEIIVYINYYFCVLEEALLLPSLYLANCVTFYLNYTFRSFLKNIILCGNLEAESHVLAWRMRNNDKTGIFC